MLQAAAILPAPLTVWTPPVYNAGVDFDCGTGVCVGIGAPLWAAAADQLALAMNTLSAAFGWPNRTRTGTGALDSDDLKLAQALGKVITQTYGVASPLLTQLATWTQPDDLAQYPTHLAIDFNQAAAGVKKLAVTAAAQKSRLVHYLIAGGSTLAVIGGTIAIVSVARTRKRRRT